MASVLGEALGPSNGFRHAIKGRVRRGVDIAPYLSLSFNFAT
jgi:hypothetical protein